MTVKFVKAKPRAVLLVCGKCEKKMGSAGKYAKPLKKLLKPSRIKVVRTKCLGVCPGNSVTMHDSRKAQEWMIVRGSTPVEEVAELLFETVG